MTASEFKNKIDASSSILLLVPHIIDADVIASLGLVYKYLNTQGKTVTIATSRQIPERFDHLLEMSGIDKEKIESVLKPVSYVIRVGDAKDQINVKWEKKDSDLDVVLTPYAQEIDFTKVSFFKEGGIYDLVVIINSRKLRDLGKIYSEYKGLFERYQIVALSHLGVEEIEGDSIVDENYSTTTEVVYKNLPDMGASIDENDAKLTAHGVIGTTFGLHQVKKAATYGVIQELIEKFNVNIAEITDLYFYSYNKSDIALRERILKNVKFDDGRKTVYSVLTNQDFTQLGVSSKQLDGNDYLPFNVCEGYEFAFLVVEEGVRSYALLHSNSGDTRITEIAESLGGYANGYFALINFDKGSSEAINAVLSSIGGGSAPSTSPEGTPGDSGTVPSASSESGATSSATSSSSDAPNQGENKSEGEKSETSAPTSSPFQKAEGEVVDPNAPKGNETSSVPFKKN